MQEQKFAIDCSYRGINEFITQQWRCSLQEVDVNSDAMLGSVQKGVYRALFWYEHWMLSVFFSKFAKKRDVNPKQDRNNEKEISAIFVDIYIIVFL